jgi:uncharacterized membrane protein YfcA
VILFLIVAVLAIGFSIGLVGIGGIFLVPLLVFIMHMPIEDAIGTALFTFVFTGIFATVLYARHRRIEWRTAAILAIGSIVAAPIGARVSESLPPAAVKVLLALFLIVVGVATLLRRHPHGRIRLTSLPALVACGFAAGFGAGLTGVGGPAILVPMLVGIGVPAPSAIAVSQPNQIASSFSGAAAHAFFRHLDLRFAAFLTVLELVGVVAGSEIGVRTDPSRLRSIASVASIVAGAWTAIRTLMPA